MKPLTYLQFQRIGYFNVDPDSTPEKMVFNRTVGSGCGNHALHSACGAFAVGTRAVAEKVCGKRGACCGYADNGDKPDFVYVNATKNARKPRVLFLNLFFQIMLIWQARMASMAFLCRSGVTPAQQLSTTFISASGKNAFSKSAFEITQMSVQTPTRSMQSN